MSMTTNEPKVAVTSKRRDGLVGFWGRIVHRDRAAYEHWLEDHDLTVITAALLRLNERQLSRLGFSRSTLALDIQDLVEKAKRDAAMTDEILRIVETDEDEAHQDRRMAFAAE